MRDIKGLMSLSPSLLPPLPLSPPLYPSILPPSPPLFPSLPLPPSLPPTHPEASKLVMQYVAAVSGKGQGVDKVKEQLLQSNPVLEGVLSMFAFLPYMMSFPTSPVCHTHENTHT